MKRLAAVLMMVALLGCCGLLSDMGNGDIADSEEESGKTSIGRDKTDRGTVIKYAGTYYVVGEGYEATLKIKRAKGFAYDLEWTNPTEDEILTGLGVENDGYLGYGDAGEGGVIGVYKRQGDDITGLWALVQGDMVLVERSGDVGRMYTSDPGVEGTWKVRHEDDEEPYTYYMTIEENGNTWVVSHESEDGFISVGIGLSVDQILVTGFDIGGSKIITVYTVDGDKMKGRWAFTWFNNQTGAEELETGTETALRQ